MGTQLHKDELGLWGPYMQTSCLEQGCNEGYPRQKKIHGWKVSGIRLRCDSFY